MDLTMVWISFCGSQKEAEEYEYSIKICSPAGGKKHLLTGKRKCMSVDVSHEDVKQKGNALFLNKDMLESAANEYDRELEV